MSTLHLLTHLELAKFFPSLLFSPNANPRPRLVPSLPGIRNLTYGRTSSPPFPALPLGSFPPPFAFALALAGISGNTGTRGIGREAVGTLGLVLPGAGEYYWLVIGLGL